MAIFDMITNPPKYLMPQADAISNRYFTVDTASMDVVDEWVEFNPYIVTYAMYEGRVAGFFNVMPLTMESGDKFMRHEMVEEDLRTQDMLMHEALPFAKYAYVAAIAIESTDSYLNRQCAAALVGAMADLLLYGYNREHFRMLFANPTTFQGNKLVRRLGLKPLQNYKKSLKSNDIYASTMDEETRTSLENLSNRYARFIGTNPWKSS